SHRRTATSAAPCMSVLSFLIENLNSAVQMLSVYGNAFFFHHIKEYLPSYFSKIPCYDPVIIFRRSVKIFKICLNGAAGGRCHTGSHIQRVFQAKIHDFSCSDSRNPGMTLPGTQNTGSASRHCPCGGKRTLIAVPQRKSELLLCTCKMAGSYCPHILSEFSRHSHRSKGQGFSHCGAGAIESIYRSVESHDPKGGSNGLSQKISRIDQPKIILTDPCFIHSKRQCLFLQSAFRLFP